MELIIGPGVQEKYLPEYPTRKDSPLLESDFKYASTYYATVFCFFRMSFCGSLKENLLPVFYNGSPRDVHRLRTLCHIDNSYVTSER